MSLLISINNELTTMDEYLMAESFQPVISQYGPNSDCEGNTFKKIGNTCIAYFNEDGLYYIAYLDTKTGNTGFGVSEIKSDEVEDYTDDRKNTSKALRVFNRFIYIIMQVGKAEHATYVRFSAANPSLGKIYQRAVKNNFLLQSLERQGWSYIGEHNGYYVFQQNDSQLPSHHWKTIINKP